MFFIFYFIATFLGLCNMLLNFLMEILVIILSFLTFPLFALFPGGQYLFFMALYIAFVHSKLGISRSFLANRSKFIIYLDLQLYTVRIYYLHQSELSQLSLVPVIHLNFRSIIGLLSRFPVIQKCFCFSYPLVNLVVGSRSNS